MFQEDLGQDWLWGEGGFSYRSTPLIVKQKNEETLAGGKAFLKQAAIHQYG